ncbi:MAG: PucR family transcriptional regulator [Eubacterium sp.]|jgi:hypothetical protein
MMSLRQLLKQSANGLPPDVTVIFPGGDALPGESPISAGNALGNRMIRHVDLLRRDTLFDPDTLYLCHGQLPAPVHLPAHPEDFLLLLARPQVSPFTVLCAAKPFSAPELFRVLNERLALEDRLESAVSRLCHTLYTGDGLDRLAIELEHCLSHPVSILDASYNMLASSPSMAQVSFGIKTSGADRFLASSEIESLRRLQIEDRIYGASEAFCVSPVDHPDTNWIFAGIRIHHVMTGYVAVCLPGDQTASEYELRLTTAFAEICSVEMQKHDFFIERTGMQYENFLIELLEGRFSDVNLIASRLELLNRRFGHFFCIITLDCTVPHDSSLFNERQMSTLRKFYPNCMSVVYKDRIVLFINQDTPVQTTPEYLSPLEDFCRRNSMIAGISQPFSDILKINRFYEQSVRTLELLSDTAGPDQILFYSTDALVPYLFSCCDYPGLEIGIHHHLFELRDHDEANHTEFIRTLHTYLDCDRNATRTAEALHIHRSTFFYRVKKIEELLGISITDSRLLFLYELSFRILDYLSR